MTDGGPRPQPRRDPSWGFLLSKPLEPELIRNGKAPEPNTDRPAAFVHQRSTILSARAKDKDGAGIRGAQPRGGVGRLSRGHGAVLLVVQKQTPGISL